MSKYTDWLKQSKELADNKPVRELGGGLIVTLLPNGKVSIDTSGGWNYAHLSNEQAKNLLVFLQEIFS